jgi:hypothetical protein
VNRISAEKLVPGSSETQVPACGVPDGAWFDVDYPNAIEISYNVTRIH